MRQLGAFDDKERQLSWTDNKDLRQRKMVNYYQNLRQFDSQNTPLYLGIRHPYRPRKKIDIEAGMSSASEESIYEDSEEPEEDDGSTESFVRLPIRIQGNVPNGEWELILKTIFLVIVLLGFILLGAYAFDGDEAASDCYTAFKKNDCSISSPT